MIGKAIRNQVAEHPLDFQIYVGHEIDDALLVDANVAAEACDLNRAGPHHGLDGRGEQERVETRH